MVELILEVRRPFTDVYTGLHGEDEKIRQEFHLQRAKLLHDIVNVLNLEVKNWGNTDAKHSHEVVEIITVLGSAGAFSALVSIIKYALEQRKLKEVYFKKSPNGEIIFSVGEAGPREIQKVCQDLGLCPESKSKKPRKKAVIP